MVTTKHVINPSSSSGSSASDSENATDSARAILASAGPMGLATMNDDVCVLEEHKVVVRKALGGNGGGDKKESQVALISGGGSGHEPAHAGFVGPGLLSAAVCGNVFASPNVGQIRAAVRCLEEDMRQQQGGESEGQGDGGAGVIAIIMRYTGDVLLFGLAVEQHRASASASSPSSSIPFLLTVVGDDVAVPRSQGALVGRRGLAGTILVYKLAGALAEQGAGVKEVHELAEWAATRVGTIGAGLEHCHVPGAEKGESHLGDDEVEIGMGIHNEPGVLKMPLPTSQELVATMLRMVYDTSDEDRAFLDFKLDGKDEVVLMVNNLGGMSELELASIANDAAEHLAGLPQPIHVRRAMAGSFMTSLNLPGFSLTLLLLPRAGEKYSSEQVLELFDAPASAPGWKQPSKVDLAGRVRKPLAKDSGERSADKNGIALSDFSRFRDALIAACKSVIAAEPEITRFDTIAGDGDCGLTLKSGAEGVLELIQSTRFAEYETDAVGAILEIAKVIEKRMDGTSGALYSIWTNALAAGLRSAGSASADGVAQALEHALGVLFTYTPARRPSRTLVDPLQAFTESLAKIQGADLAQALADARKAAEETKDLVAKAGRAAYVGREELQKAQVPDPGAWGVVKLLEGFSGQL